MQLNLQESDLGTVTVKDPEKGHEKDFPLDEIFVALAEARDDPETKTDHDVYKKFSSYLVDRLGFPQLTTAQLILVADHANNAMTEFKKKFLTKESSDS